MKALHLLPALIAILGVTVMFMTSCSPKPEAHAAYEDARRAMVERQLKPRGITDKRVLQAMLTVPRHNFVPAREAAFAYEDRPLDIGHQQTISQPYIVALMTEKLAPKPTDIVLEVGTGSGYQAAVLANLVDRVYTIEIIKPLADSAARTLKRLGYKNVTVKCGDGYEGWKEHAPYDAIIVTCAPEHVPRPLVDQLKDGGRMVIPVGRYTQELVLLTKKGGTVHQTDLIPVLFVPMTGEARHAPP